MPCLGVRPSANGAGLLKTEAFFGHFTRARLQLVATVAPGEEPRRATVGQTP